jgi:type 1 glutamine amidotransferase
MKKVACLLLGLAVASVLMVGPADAKVAPLRACFISGSTEYESDNTLPILKKYLEARFPSYITIVSAKSDSDLPGLNALDSCEVVGLFTRRLKLEGDQLDRLKKYCNSGKPLVGIRTASHGIQTWLDLDKDILGGNYKGHYDAGPVCEVKIPEALLTHQILRGVKPFKSQGSLYKNTGLAKDVEVLLTGSIPDHTEPIAWTREKGRRMFYTSLGHQKDFEEESFLRLMTNGILWAADRKLRKGG